MPRCLVRSLTEIGEVRNERGRRHHLESFARSFGSIFDVPVAVVVEYTEYDVPSIRVLIEKR